MSQRLSEYHMRNERDKERVAWLEESKVTINIRVPLPLEVYRLVLFHL